MKLIYLIGAYNAPTLEERETNMDIMVGVAREIIEGFTGIFVPVVPHIQGHYLDNNYGEHYWRAHTIELLKGCDCALVVGDVSSSAGSQAEVEYCKTKRMPCRSYNPCDGILTFEIELLLREVG